METGRRQHNLTVLADGTVLATGGNSSGEPLIDMENGVYTAELWDPATGEWTTLDSMQVTRQYHSSALLLPDGRVLSAGGGICGDCNARRLPGQERRGVHPAVSVQGRRLGRARPRPRITSAPRVVDYDEPMTVGTRSAGSIGKVAMVRLGAVTHSVNMEQRYVPLSFTAGAGALARRPPANPNIAPPGVYMLFVLKPNGVPSVARMIRIAEGGCPDNAFSFGKVKLNKRNGTAGLPAKVAGAGADRAAATKQVKGAESDGRRAPHGEARGEAEGRDEAKADAARRGDGQARRHLHSDRRRSQNQAQDPETGQTLIRIKLALGYLGTGLR